jgi:hypothetical protein
LPERSILIVHPDRKTQRVVQRILGVTGHRVDICDELEQAAWLVERHAPALVVVGSEAIDSPHAGAFFAAVAAKGAEACMTLLGGMPTARIPHIVRTGAVTNLLVHAMPVLAEELTITAHKLLTGELFGAEKYLLWGTQLQATTLARGGERAATVEKLSEAIRARGQSARVASMAMLVADELISNAVHNAPIDAAGVHYRKDLPRDGELDLDDRHRVTLRWGCDARYVAIEVSDSFGSLDRDTILRSLATSDVRATGGGAGMGIALAYRSCDHLVFNLAPGRRTEIIALIDVRHPPSERLPASSYNVFVERAS